MESINSSEEFDQQQEDVDLGVGRSYECVFCKRGFNTAQALGGHMNIHRKDRVKTKPSTSPNKQEETTYNVYTGPRLYQQIPISSYNNPHIAPHLGDDDHHQPHMMNYPTYGYSRASTSSNRPLIYGDEHHNPQYDYDYDYDRDHFQQPSIDPSSIPAGNWRMSMGLNFSQDLEKNSQVMMNKKEEIDLELRLGYD